jgi:hypothetical protein
MDTESLRPLPRWSWILACLFFPVGFFVAYGAAGLLRWPKASTLAVVSYGSLIAFGFLMQFLDHSGASMVIRSLATIGGLTLLCGWGFLLYRTGKEHDYWSAQAHRFWKGFGWFAIVLLGINCLATAALLVITLLRGS